MFVHQGRVGVCCVKAGLAAPREAALERLNACTLARLNFVVAVTPALDAAHAFADVGDLRALLTPLLDTVSTPGRA
jgi:hypothetical protein